MARGVSWANMGQHPCTFATSDVIHFWHPGRFRCVGPCTTNVGQLTLCILALARHPGTGYAGMETAQKIFNLIDGNDPHIHIFFYFAAKLTVTLTEMCNDTCWNRCVHKFCPSWARVECRHINIMCVNARFFSFFPSRSFQIF